MHHVKAITPLALTFLLLVNEAMSLPFSISVVQKQMVEQQGGTNYSIVASADSGFTADIFLRVSSPSLPASAFTFSNPRFDHPYAEPIRLTVNTSGDVEAGQHRIVVEGYNGSSVSTDTCVLLIPERSGWTVYTTSNSGLPSNAVHTVQFDTSGHAWIGTDNGVAQFDGASWKTYLDGRIAYVALQRGTTPWVLNNTSIWRLQGSEFRTFTDTAITGRVQNLCAGRDGEIWVYSRTPDKLARITDDSIQVFDMDHLTSDNMWAAVTAMHVDRNNKLWLGFSGYNREWIVTYDGSYWNAYERSRFQLADYQSTSRLVEDTEHGVWSISTDGLVHVRGEESTSYPANTSGVFPGFWPTAYAVDSVYGDRWVGVSRTANHPSQPVGIARYTDRGRVVYQSSNSPLPESTINDLQADASGRLWAATYKGLVVMAINLIPGTVSVDEENAPNLSRGVGTIDVRPNPSDGRPTVSLRGWPKSDEINVVVRTTAGEVVQEIFHGTVSDEIMTLTLPAHGMASGYYLLQVHGRATSASIPLIVLP